MFKPFYGGTCSQCQKDEQLIVIKSGVCQICNHKNKEAKKKASGKKSSVYKYVKEANGEGEMFRELALNMLDEEATRCWICGLPIPALTYSNMSHVLPKGKYPLFRLRPDNIKILCHRLVADENGKNGCHNQLDGRPRSEIINDPNWQKFFELEEQLKEEYKSITDL